MLWLDGIHDFDDFDDCNYFQDIDVFDACDDRDDFEIFVDCNDFDDFDIWTEPVTKEHFLGHLKTRSLDSKQLLQSSAVISMYVLKCCLLIKHESGLAEH